MGRGGRSAAAFAAGNDRLVQAKHILESSVLADRDTEVLRQHAKDRGIKTDGTRDELLIALHPFSKVRTRRVSKVCVWFLLRCHRDSTRGRCGRFLRRSHYSYKSMYVCSRLHVATAAPFFHVLFGHCDSLLCLCFSAQQELQKRFKQRSHL